jgi:hypothetical protein
MARQSWVELFTTQTTDGTAVANTTTETTIFTAVTIPAGYLQGSRAMGVKAMGRFSTTATPTIRFRLRLGGVAGTLVWDSGTITLTTVTAALWWLDVLIVGRSDGPTGTVMGIGPCIVGSALAPAVASATGAAAVGIFGSGGDDTPAVATLDLGADQALVVTATWSAASASNTLTGHNFLVLSYN